MSVDLEAIAQRRRCDVSSLRLALPLLEQGYTPPFLARYRRDELGGLDESSLWALSSALQTQRQVAQRREELREVWQQTSLRDPAIGHAVSKSNSLRMLSRLGRRLKAEASDTGSDAARLAVRVLNPEKGDAGTFAEIAAKVDGITNIEAAVAGLDQALAKRLAGDPRVIGAAVRWLVKHARIHVASIRDPHTGEDKPQGTPAKADATAKSDATSTAPSDAVSDADVAAPSTSTESSATTEESTAADTTTAEPTPEPESAAQETATNVEEASIQSSPEAALEKQPVASVPPAGDAVISEPETSKPETSEPATSKPVAAEPVAAEKKAEGSSKKAEGSSKKAEGSSKKAAKSKPKDGAKKQKKISPRQRRRRWLVGVLKPLEGKKLNCDKLSSFQIVMLGRALRSQVAECSFEYDATKLVAELQRAAEGINRNIGEQLRSIVLQHEANIREAAETAWWDDLHERASTRLVSITADHLRRHVNRGAVEAKVVMAIDAVGPRTAATSIVSADGRLLHSEDLPCQLSSALRSQAVSRMGELIHTYHVDLLIVSNGPARRATMIALGDLIAQSPENSVRWTLADRSGADAYAGSATANEEMRSTPRRFRAAAWLAFAVLQPAQALAKVDPLKLRLSSFQRELSDDAMSSSLNDVMVSGASRGGVDVNSAPVSWLARLPGLTHKVAEAIDSSRRHSLFESRESVSDLDQWEDAVQTRQAIPFLRVFGGKEVLDGTLIHPEDYALAKKLAAALEIELPPDAPPGYVKPDFSVHPEPAEGKLAEATPEPVRVEVEEFTATADGAADFAVDMISEDEPSEPVQTSSDDPEQPAGDADSDQPVVETPVAETPVAETPVAETEPTSTEAPVDAGGEAESDSSDQETNSMEAADSTDAEPSGAPVETSTPPMAADIPDPIKRPRPEKAKIDKCVKEWQIGAQRAEQLVQWLCDPFGDSDSTDSPPAVLTNMPTAKSLKTGDTVIGVVVGVMPFGVFVELAPDCSGLIHVSRVSDSYVEDLHEAVQVGDVVTAWVTGIDDKRRRVALSAVSPQREAELEEAKRHASDDRSQRGGPRRGGDRGQQSRQPRGADSRGGTGQQAGANQSRGGQSRGNQGRTTQRGGENQTRGKDQGRGGRSRDPRGGRSRDSRGGGRGREKKPESYRVVGKQEEKPITDAMQKGEEPLRSFGDLLQFFDKTTTTDSEQPESQQQQPEQQQPEQQQPEQQQPEQQQPEQSKPAEQPPSASTEAASPTASDSTTNRDAQGEASAPSSEKDRVKNEVGSDTPNTEPSSPADASTS